MLCVQPRLELNLNELFSGMIVPLPNLLAFLGGGNEPDCALHGCTYKTGKVPKAGRLFPSLSLLSTN